MANRLLLESSNTDGYLLEDGSGDVLLDEPATYAELILGSPGVKGYWQLDETAGTQADDSSGLAHHGTYTGSYTLNQTKVRPGSTGGAVDLSPTTNGRVEIGDHADYDIANGPWSVEAWLSLDTLAADPGRTIMSKGTGGLLVRIVGTPNADIQVVRSHQSFINNGGPDFSTATNYYVVVVYSGTDGTLDFWVDGVLDVTKPASDADFINNALALIIGRDHDESPWDGRMSDVVFHNVALSPAHVIDHNTYGRIPDNSPMVESVTDTTINANTTTHTINLPAAVAAGDLLVLVGMMDWNSAPTITWDAELTPFDNAGKNGWESNGVNVAILMAWKEADGSEGGTTWVNTISGVGETSLWKVYRIRNWNGTPPEATWFDGATSTTPNPPAITPSWGADANLYIAAAVSDGASNSFPGFPTGYAGTSLVGTDGALGVAYVHKATSPEDPGTFTTGLSEQNATGTIVITSKVTAGATTVTGSFTANAILKAARTGSFLANAVIKKTQTGTFALNAVIKRTQTGTTTANATIKRTQTGTFTANASLVITKTGSLTANATLKKTLSGTTTANAVIKGTRPGTFAANAVLRKTLSGTFTASAELRKIVAGAFTADAVLDLVGRAVWTTPGDTVAISDSPVLTFLMPEASGPMHFQMELDDNSGFSSPDVFDSSVSQTGWQYWNDSAWTAVPEAGVDPSYSGNEARYTVQAPLAPGTYYRRVRAGIVI